jgi:multidrug efflux pump subunit AcrB
MAHKSDSEIIEHTHNASRYFVEHRQVALVLLLAVVLWGWYGYQRMPKRKDPYIPVRVAVAGCSWPGATAEQVEQLITRPIENAVSQNAYLQKPVASDYALRSLSMPGLSIVYVQLDESVKDTRKQFSDIQLKLASVSLPAGASPIQFNSDFGDTSALMLTVASPKVSDIEVSVRARAIESAIEQARDGEVTSPRVSLIYCYPYSVPVDLIKRGMLQFQAAATQDKTISDVHWLEGPGFMGLDVQSALNDQQLLAYGRKFIADRLQKSEFAPDAWDPVVIRQPGETKSVLASVAGDKYTYAELEHYTDLIGRSLQNVNEVSKVSRSGVLPERIYLDYSQERLAAYGLKPADLGAVLNARNVTASGGVLEVAKQDVNIIPSGQFLKSSAIGNVAVGSAKSGAPVYLRDLVQISRSYELPPKFLNFLTWKDANGVWHRSRAVTVAVQMRDGEQIGKFGDDVSAKLDSVKRYLPDDLILAHTSDQPLQVKENLELFMDALFEAVVLVVVVSLIGFWEWRSALLMAISIPITLAMTLGLMQMLGIDLQQTSIAAMIIALGLLVDNPVVAGDSIKRSLAAGHTGIIAAWLGPTRLAHAIMYATITNVAAYLPFLMLTGTTGTFMYSLPIGMACSLVSSFVVAMTFVPLLGYYFLRTPKKEKTLEERRHNGFTGFYAKVAKGAIDHRWKVLAGAMVFLMAGGVLLTHLKTAFFPNDLQYWSYVDVWLPNGSSVTASDETAKQVEAIVRETVEKYAREHPSKKYLPEELLRYVTSFVGGGGPRFWFSVTPELQQTNYAQVLIQIADKDVTPKLGPVLQEALSRSVPGARCDVRQLQTNPVDYPVEIRVSTRDDDNPAQEATDIQSLREVASRVEDILRASPHAIRVHSDWQGVQPMVALDVNADRANLSGLTNYDVAQSAATAISGQTVTTLREGDNQIPVVARAQMDERAQLSDVGNLYAYSSQQHTKVPLTQFATEKMQMQEGKIVRLEHFRTISVRAFPKTGSLASEVTEDVIPKLKELQRSLPASYRIDIGGEYDKQRSGFINLAQVLAISVAAIFLALLIQFQSAVKPILVFAATPFGVVGAVAGLWIMGEPFGFMAFLGVASLIGVIVSHVIVLFDFIEEQHEKGEPLQQALIDAGIQRLRPVMITVAATVLALFPLAMHGGPLWQPLCYAQIGGLSIATFITLLLVPVLYSIFVLDLRIIRWERPEAAEVPVESEKGLQAKDENDPANIGNAAAD